MKVIEIPSRALPKTAPKTPAHPHDPVLHLQTLPRSRPLLVSSLPKTSIPPAAALSTAEWSARALGAEPLGFSSVQRLASAHSAQFASFPSPRGTHATQAFSCQFLLQICILKLSESFRANPAEKHQFSQIPA